MRIFSLTFSSQLMVTDDFKNHFGYFFFDDWIAEKSEQSQHKQSDLFTKLNEL